MGYHVIDPDDVERAPDRPSDMRYVSEAANLSNVGLREYRVEPGEDIPLVGLHYHDEQEEAFYVVEGTLTVETPDDEYTVESGQFFVAEPGSPHRAYVPSEGDPVRAVAVGAPAVDDGHAYDQ